jgi:hypothetical protein
MHKNSGYREGLTWTFRIMEIAERDEIKIILQAEIRRLK